MSADTLPATQDSRDARISALTTRGQMTPAQVSLLKRTVAKGATDDELSLFVAVCGRTGLDPFTRQIHFVKRWDSAAGMEVGSFQTGIDGYRLTAQRSHEYDGQDAPEWCDDLGVWTEIWTQTAAPFAARIKVYRKGCPRAFVGIARWGAYVQTKKDGTPTKFWRTMGPEQLAKCAEALALRKAFPAELSGLYTREELAHIAEAEVVDEIVREAPLPPARQARSRSAARAIEAARPLPGEARREMAPDGATWTTNDTTKAMTDHTFAARATAEREEVAAFNAAHPVPPPGTFKGGPEGLPGSGKLPESSPEVKAAIKRLQAITGLFEPQPLRDEVGRVLFMEPGEIASLRGMGAEVLNTAADLLAAEKAGAAEASANAEGEQPEPRPAEAVVGAAKAEPAQTTPEPPPTQIQMDMETQLELSRACVARGWKTRAQMLQGCSMVMSQIRLKLGQPVCIYGDSSEISKAEALAIIDWLASRAKGARSERHQ
jgi:phage recombination protein Bet